MTAIRVHLPAHLRALARLDEHEVTVEVDDPASQRSVLDALEALHPALLGTVRDRHTGRRRSFVRFYADSEDLSHDSPDDPLPESVVTGREPLLVIGAMAGG
ncbi:MoaD/ThiS family protein [soil metagenome]